MANSSDILPSQLPNPFTPMAFLPPEVAYQSTIVTYVLVGTLGVLVWDILAHLSADYKLLTQYRINIPTLIYYLSRWSSLLYTVLRVSFQTAQIENCAVFAKVTCAAYHPAVSATALLFFFRVRALYDGNKYITAVFVVMWLAVVGASLTVIMSLTGVHVGNTKYCTFTEFLPFYGTSSVIVNSVFDTCTFAAISWRLLANAPPASNTSTSGKFGLFGKYLPRFSRALLRDGQNYYMVAMICNFPGVILTYAHGIPPVYQSIYLIPSVGLTNIMACRVFRHTKLGHHDNEINTGTLSTMFVQSRHTAPVFIHNQRARSTMHSIPGSDIHTSSINDMDIPSSRNSAEKLPRLPREASVV